MEQLFSHVENSKSRKAKVCQGCLFDLMSNADFTLFHTFYLFYTTYVLSLIDDLLTIAIYSTIILNRVVWCGDMKIGEVQFGFGCVCFRCFQISKLFDTIHLVHIEQKGWICLIRNTVNIVKYYYYKGS